MNGLVDTNILVYAANCDDPRSSMARSFLESRFTGNDNTYLCWPVIYEFLRVTTHSRFSSKPLKWDESWRFIDALLHVRSVEVIREGPDHAIYVKETLKDIQKAQGNLIHDCHIAGIMKENGIVTIFTHDTDFRRFGFLKVFDPINDEVKTPAHI